MIDEEDNEIAYQPLWLTPIEDLLFAVHLPPLLIDQHYFLNIQRMAIGAATLKR
jgi:hypothetical protein